tara:strand:+ start:402 stop:2450 length:2049 start_codon:yes stop_codon:yes gene_type:complete
MAFLAQKLISASGATEETDDDFNLVTGLYHFDGSNGAQNNTFTGIGASGASQSWTRNGSPTQGSFSPFSTEAGKWGVLFEEDNSDFLSFSNSDFSFGTGDYTVECFVFFTGNDSTSGGIFQTANSGTSTAPAMALRDTTGLTIYTSSGQKITGNNGTFTLGVWYHLAFVRASSVIKVYKDGSLVTWDDGTTSVADTTNITGTGFAIGRYYSNDYTLDGYISNFRVTKSAVYTGAFSKPTTPLTDITNTVLLTCRNNRFMDASSEGNTVSIGAGTPKIQPFSPFAPSAEYDASTMGGSGHFVRTTNDSISLTDNSLAIGNGDFTIEGWYYFDGDNSSSVGLFQQDNGVKGPAIGWWPANSNGWQLYYGSSYVGTTESGIRMYEWIHVAFVRSSGTIKVYVNGVNSATQSDTTNYTSTNFKIGQYYSTGYGMEGYISNFKMCLNAIYTSNFTPPTALVTPTSGGSSAASTKILVNFTNAAIIDSSRKTNALTVGNAQLDTSVKKFGTASAEFDGTSDSLKLVNVVPIGYNPFTIEFFFRSNTTSLDTYYRRLYKMASVTGQSNEWAEICINHSSGSYGSGNNIFVYVPDTNGRIIGTATPFDNNWHHFALTRDTSNNFKMFVDGTQDGSTATNANNFSQSEHLVGANDTSGNGDFLGYIDELRLTMKARYTANFTAPTKAFPNL